MQGYSYARIFKDILMQGYSYVRIFLCKDIVMQGYSYHFVKKYKKLGIREVVDNAAE